METKDLSEKLNNENKIISRSFLSGTDEEDIYDWLSSLIESEYKAEDGCQIWSVTKHNYKVSIVKE